MFVLSDFWGGATIITMIAIWLMGEFRETINRGLLWILRAVFSMGAASRKPAAGRPGRPGPTNHFHGPGLPHPSPIWPRPPVGCPGLPSGRPNKMGGAPTIPEARPPGPLRTLELKGGGPVFCQAWSKNQAMPTEDVQGGGAIPCEGLGAGSQTLTG